MQNKSTRRACCFLKSEMTPKHYFFLFGKNNPCSPVDTKIWSALIEFYKKPSLTLFVWCCLLFCVSKGQKTPLQFFLILFFFLFGKNNPCSPADTKIWSALNEFYKKLLDFISLMSHSVLCFRLILELFFLQLC